MPTFHCASDLGAVLTPSLGPAGSRTLVGGHSECGCPCSRSKSPTVELGGFICSLALEDQDPKDVEAGIRELSFRGAFSMTTDRGRLSSVTFPDFPVMALTEEYRRVAADPALPFPREDRVPVAIPETDLVTVEAKGHLGTLMESASIHEAGAVKLLFPENVPAMVIPRSCVDTDLIEAAVSRISRHLQDPRNAALAESKLLGALKGSEGQARQALEDITLRPRKATSTVMSPTDFSFRFWSHLSNKLVADIGADHTEMALVQARQAEVAVPMGRAAYEDQDRQHGQGAPDPIARG